MQELLQQIKTILEYERATFGDCVVLTSGEEVEPPRKSRASEGPAPQVLKSEASPPKINVSKMPRTELFATNSTFDADPSTSSHERIHALIPDNSPLRSMTTLEEVESYVSRTILIPLDETRKNPVFGVGNPAADLMVIGEAPGADEDEQGEPFVGRAGQLLTKILESIQFKREDVYIANILKSRPPNNRNPLPAEVEAHVPILYKQIALIRPKIILCVGKTSGTTLLNKQTTLGALRQKCHNFHGLPVLVTYHPAALLRNPNWKRPTWEDVKLLRRLYDEVSEPVEAV